MQLKSIHLKIFIFGFYIILLSSCKPKLDISGIYRYALSEIIFHYSNIDKLKPQLDRDKVIVSEIGVGDENFYLNLKKNPHYKRYKLTFKEIEKLKISDRYGFNKGQGATIKISDEFFYNDNNEFIIFFMLIENGGGEYNRMHFKLVNQRFELIKIIEEVLYLE